MREDALHLAHYPRRELRRQCGQTGRLQPIAIQQHMKLAKPNRTKKTMWLPGNSISGSNVLRLSPDARSALLEEPDEEKTKGSVESRKRIEELLRRTGARMWIGHSMEHSA